jgi:hypothetical protein
MFEYVPYCATPFPLGYPAPVGIVAEFCGVADADGVPAKFDKSQKDGNTVYVATQSLIVPIGHAHSLDPAVLLVTIGHCRHTLEPAGEYVPAAHCVTTPPTQ